MTAVEYVVDVPVWKIEAGIAWDLNQPKLDDLLAHLNLFPD